jgi:hypothetical protein
MDETTRAARVALIRDHCQKPLHAVLFDEPGGTLFDVTAAKTLPLRASELQAVEPRTDRQTGAPYLLLVYEDGRQLALTQAGIGFEPSFVNTGPLEDLPPVTCWRDYQGLLDRLKHDLYGHPDQAPTRATVVLMMMCLAIIDGGRAAGFDVSREEREAEKHLQELEKRAAPPPAPP